MKYLTEEKFEQYQKHTDAQFKTTDGRLSVVEFELKELRKEFKQMFSVVEEKFEKIIRMLDKDTHWKSETDAEVASAHARLDRVEGHLGVSVLYWLFLKKRRGLLRPRLCYNVVAMKEFILSNNIAGQPKIDYQKELNEEQLQVVLGGDGPCLVLA